MEELTEAPHVWEDTNAVILHQKLAEKQPEVRGQKSGLKSADAVLRKDSRDPDQVFGKIMPAPLHQGLRPQRAEALPMAHDHAGKHHHFRQRSRHNHQRPAHK